MIGKNTLMLTDETVHQIVEKYFRSHLFRDGDFTISNIERKTYPTDHWEVILKGKEIEQEVTLKGKEIEQEVTLSQENHRA